MGLRAKKLELRARTSIFAPYLEMHATKRAMKVRNCGEKLGSAVEERPFRAAFAARNKGL
jgi:hypothetical protein